MKFTSGRKAFAAALVLAAVPAAAGAAVRLDGSIVGPAAEDRVLGAADPAGMLHFQVALRLRDAAGLNAGNRAHLHLSASQLAARHLPLQADYDAVAAWVRGAGLTVEAVTPSRLSIGVAGRADAVSHALSVHFSHVISDGEDVISADTAPSVPASIAPLVVGINGLQPQLHVHPLHISHELKTQPQGNGVPPFYPSDLMTAYDANNLSTKGAGTTTAIVIDTFPKTSDLTQFWSTTGVNQSLSNITLIQVVKGTLPPLSGEESLDTQYSSSMAPASKVRVYASRTLSFKHIDDVFQAIVADMQAGVAITQVSISLGECEERVPLAQAQTDDAYFATMTAMGASVFVSSGDSGAHECNKKIKHPSFFATSPNVAQVGGTTLQLKSGGGGVSSETGWAGSGGGLSLVFPKPDYQKDLPRYKGDRAGPDLSAVANPSTGVLVIANGHSYQIGGTSVSSPVVAGLMGLANASRIAAGKPTLGLLNTRIYPLLLTNNFRDITSGNNGYAAGTGYDLVTGIGAPLMGTLLPSLTAQP